MVDLLLTNGRIHTLSHKTPILDSIACEAGRIVEPGKAKRTIDLGGRTT